MVESNPTREIGRVFVGRQQEIAVLKSARELPEQREIKVLKDRPELRDLEVLRGLPVLRVEWRRPRSMGP